MRRSFDGLSAIARDVIGEDPLSGYIFAFTNKRRNRLKLSSGTAQVFGSAPSALSEAHFLGLPDQAIQVVVFLFGMKSLLLFLPALILMVHVVVVGIAANSFRIHKQRTTTIFRVIKVLANIGRDTRRTPQKS